MWKELAKDQVWVHDDFLSPSELKLVLKEWEQFKSFHTLEQKEDSYLLAPTYYHSKQPKRPPKLKKEIQKFVIKRLNTLYEVVFDKTAPDENLTYAQFYFKEAEPGVSRFDLHCEPGPNDKHNFGDCVFLLYLTDEQDGEIICPSEKDAQHLVNDVYNKSIAEMSVKYVDETISLLPKVNRCVVLRNGAPHYVPVCSGIRKCVTGWSFIPRKLTTINK